jgi:hypothetical protein
MKWQYLVIQVALRSNGADYDCDQAAIANALRGKPVSEALSYLGSQGWELGASTLGAATGSKVLYFQRPA